MKKLLVTIFFITALFSQSTIAQGTWTALTNLSPDTNAGVMILLSDGTVIAKSLSCSCDTFGNAWDKLTPDSLGSYANGTWSKIAPMHDTRFYFASQVLKDGRIFVAGGEYGTGKKTAETYNPVNDTWTQAPALNKLIADANSEILDDGRVLLATLDGTGNNTSIFNPKTNTWSAGPTCKGGHDESAWVKLADNSILFVDFGSKNSERYIPSLNQWVVDAHVPDTLYDPFWFETGAAFLLPDKRAFFLGSTGHTAYYTPSGNTSAGTWVSGPDIPLVYGKKYGTVDAAAAMMVNGKILCTASPVNTSQDLASSFQAPTAYYEFDYLANAFTRISAPDGSDTLSGVACFETNMLDLPDGTILYSTQYSKQYYIYTPDGTPLVSGKPTISNITQLNCDTFKITGTLFNGISEGAGYGDDWQMATNYPIVKLTDGVKTYYARSFNWNSTNVQRGNLPDTAFFTIPSSLAYATYSLSVSANGISSDPIVFVNSVCSVGIEEVKKTNSTHLLVYPNPADEQITVSFMAKVDGVYSIQLLDIFGRAIKQQVNNSNVGDNKQTLLLDGIAKGIYLVVFQKGEEIIKTRVVIR